MKRTPVKNAQYRAPKPLPRLNHLVYKNKAVGIDQAFKEDLKARSRPASFFDASTRQFTTLVDMNIFEPRTVRYGTVSLWTLMDDNKKGAFLSIERKVKDQPATTPAVDCLLLRTCFTDLAVCKVEASDKFVGVTWGDVMQTLREICQKLNKHDFILHFFKGWSIQFDPVTQCNVLSLI